MSNSAQLVSDAWLLRGISSVQGQLKLVDGRLSFVASGFGSLWKWQLDKLERDAGRSGIANSMDAGSEATVFEAPLANVEIDFPWYYFSGGVKCKIGNAKYRLSFGRPSNSRLPVDKSDILEAGKRAIEEFQEVAVMRRIGKAWKTALGK